MQSACPNAGRLSIANRSPTLDWTTFLPDLLPSDALSSIPPDVAADPAVMLDWLVKARLLTVYQGEKLRGGQGHALTIGPYRLLAPLARGGMGMVYLAAGSDGGAVAIKLLSPRRAASEPQLRARFHREQHIGTRLPAHPHLVRQLDYGISRAGVEFLVLNHLPGRTVRQQLSISGPLPVGMACRVFADATAGLQVAHQAGVIHRDLKPSNIMIGPTARGTVFDFGLARIEGEPGDPRVVGGPRYTVGTLDFMPPEQVADAGSVGPTADLYALGAGIFTALTGRTPFVSEGMTGKLTALRTEIPPSVLELRADVPAPLCDLIRSLLGKHPGERPQSASEVVAVLEEWADRIDGDPVPDRRPLDEVVAEAESAWANRGVTDRSHTQTVTTPTPPPVVRLRYWQLLLLSTAILGLAGVAAGLGRLLATGRLLL